MGTDHSIPELSGGKACRGWHERTGRPCGDGAFLKALERQLGRVLEAQKDDDVRLEPLGRGKVHKTVKFGPETQTSPCTPERSV